MINISLVQKKFWRSVKPSFSYKVGCSNRAILRDSREIICYRKSCLWLQKNFVNIGNTENLQTKQQQQQQQQQRFLIETNDVFDPVLKAVRK